MIVGLDLGEKIGWCKGAAVGPMDFGTIQVEGGSDLGAFLTSAMEQLPAVLRGASGIAVEQPFLGDSYYPARKLLALLGVVHQVARWEGIGSKQIEEIPIATGKLTLSGYGKADKGMMIMAAAERGYFDLDEHQADALGIWWTYVFGRREKNKPARRRKV